MLVMLVLLKMPQMDMYSLTHPMDSTEFTLMNERTEFALSTLKADVELKMLPNEAADNTEKIEKNDMNDAMESALYAE